MKRNLFTGIFLISAIALSSCSTMDKLSKSEDMGDDVYFTKAKAGDQFDYVAQYNQQQASNVRNDDYYYYGDYESRINRFGYYSPFAYQDDYYSYVPYSYYTPAVSAYDYGYNPYYDFGTYVAFDFGFGYYGGYDNYGYGNAYSSYIYGGGSRHHGRGYSGWGNGGGGTGLAFTPANAAYPLSRYIANNPGSNSGTTTGPRFVRANGAPAGGGLYSGSRPGGTNAVYPGRPGTNAVTPVGSTSNNTANTPYVRPASENPRPVVQQPNIERAAPVQSSPPPSNSGSSNSGSSSSSGGGGRPVRP
ncbi:hypothetical protein [Mucilaginibacter sp. UYCu711]|uniref:hypothetical protein n=1 Tax=Mucilaginibacter sp. UYCu711 TaxID=3156339 RepID=UPI003D224255